MRKHVKEYVQKLELVKIKDGLKIAMAASSIVNNYIQNSEGFKLFNTNKTRSETIYHVTANLLVVVAVLLEPYMPSFSAKVYEMLNIPRTERTHTFLKEIHDSDVQQYLKFIETGHPINDPKPIFKEITDD